VSTLSGTIVADVTDNGAGQNAAEFAGALGARLDLRLVLVYVLSGVPAGAEESLSARQAQKGARQTLDEVAREIGHDAEMRLVVGDHAEAVARVAAEEGADLVVVGGRPAGLGRRNLRWTLARQLEAATPVPVLVAPPSTRRRSDRRLAVAEAETR
jgi:nucleotide-binding universal stress UspA family protein